MSEIREYRDLLELVNLFARLKQLSWTINQTQKRYPELESLTNKEVKELIKFYLSFGFDVESVYEDWKKIYDKTKK